MQNFVATLGICTCVAILAVQSNDVTAQALATLPDDSISKTTDGEPSSQTIETGLVTEKLVSDITRAFSNVRTAEGRFTQLAENQLPSEGTFAIRRPRRMRFDYDAPSPLLIVADGTTIAVADRELETVDRFPLSNSILRFLLQEDPDFEAKANIVNVEQNDQFVAITLADKSEQTEGNLSLLFSNPDYELLGWRIVDAIGATTEVYLHDVKKNHKLSPRLFRLDDFDKDQDRRR